MYLSHTGKRASQVDTILGIFLFLFFHASASPAPVNPSPVPGDHGPTFALPQFAKGQPLHMVVYGDTRFTDPAIIKGTNPRVRQWLAARIGQLRPQAILLTGDTPFTGSLPADWQVFQNETASWREAGAVQLPAIGNHEVKGDGPAGIANYLANFPAIGGHRFYSALMGSVEVLSLDFTQPSGASSTQGRWFAAQLDHIPAQVEFLLILHHIPWMADRQSEMFAGLPTKDALNLRGMLEARLPRIHARVIVFNGHIHNYERFERNGVEYVITGVGGAAPYPVLIRGLGDLYKDSAFPVYHYLTVDVANHQLHAMMWKIKDPEAKTLEDELKDEFTVTATPARKLKAPAQSGAKAHIQKVHTLNARIQNAHIQPD